LRVHRHPTIPDLELREGHLELDDRPAHIHDQYGFTLVVNGGRRLVIGPASHDIMPGEVFANNAGEKHRGTSSGPWSFRGLYVPAALLLEAAGEHGASCAPAFAAPRLRNPRLAAHLGSACDAISQPATTLERQSQLLAVLVDLVAHAYNIPLPRTGRERHAVLRVDDYVHSHLADDIHLDELAVAAGLSKYHLLRVFRAERGVTPHGFQRRLRVAWARVLLASGVPPATVAVEVGYHDQSHLTRSFKRTTGVTPARFQRQVAGPLATSTHVRGRSAHCSEMA
jgi:AraC-like DNA-binding protein